MPVQRVTVLGAGSWGTTFAKILADAGRDVTMWARRTEVADEIRYAHTNSAYLPGIRLPDRLTATSDPATALSDTDAVVLAVPSQSLRENLLAWRDLLPADAILVSLAKGVELGSLKRMSEVVSDITGGKPGDVVVVSGPNLAREIASEQPAAAVLACFFPAAPSARWRPRAGRRRCGCWRRPGAAGWPRWPARARGCARCSRRLRPRRSARA